MQAIPELNSLARQMKAAQDEARQIEPFTAQYSGFDVPTAYEVARQVHEKRLIENAIPVGRKIGFTNPEMWALYGVREPIWAYMYDSTVSYLSEGETTCSLSRFAEPKIEPEIVFHFKSAPPTTRNLSAILACIDWVAPAFEVVQSHFPGWKFRAADTVADWGLHGTLLLGEPVPVDLLGPDPVTALEKFSVTLSCNGTVIEVGKGGNVLGNPLAAVAHLMEVLARQRSAMPLQANEMISTGTLTMAQAVHAGEQWRAELSGIQLSGLSVTFAS